MTPRAGAPPQTHRRNRAQFAADPEVQAKGQASGIRTPASYVLRWPGSIPREMRASPRTAFRPKESASHKQRTEGANDSLPPSIQ